MELIRGAHNLHPRHRGSVVTIGNFDGVHRGHAVLLEQLAVLAHRLDAASTLISFEPHPLEFLRPEQAPARITQLRDKIDALGRTALQRLLLLRFNQVLAQTSAEDFVLDLLLARLGMRGLLVGDDFRFGRGRGGDFDTLSRLGEKHGFVVERLNTIREGEARISSTLIRDALSRGDLTTAERMLGRPYEISGRVIRGEAIGRELGFRTINLPLDQGRAAIHGIFAVAVSGAGLKNQPGVASVGTRPTVGGTRTLLEVHLLDFVGDLYGKHMQVRFCRRLRDEMRFASLSELRDWIARDVQAAREYFLENRI